MRPYTPLELAGRNIYIREGCYVCHSQMVRSLRDEVERYGHYSAGGGEHVRPSLPVGLQAHRPGLGAGRRQVFRRMAPGTHDRPAQPGPRVDHARLSLPGGERLRGSRIISAHLATNRGVGVPYSDEMIEHAVADCPDPGQPGRRRDRRFPGALPERPGRATSTATRASCTEMDALIAYLQMLGTLVDFDVYRHRGRQPALGDRTMEHQTVSQSSPRPGAWSILVVAFVLAVASTRSGPATGTSSSTPLRPACRSTTTGRQMAP